MIGWLSKKEIKEHLRFGFIISLRFEITGVIFPVFNRTLSLTHSRTHTIYVYILFTMLSYLTYFIENKQRHKCCNRPKSSLLYNCISLVAKYVNVVITSISGAMAFLRSVWDVSMSLICSVTPWSLHDLMCSIFINSLSCIVCSTFLLPLHVLSFFLSKKLLSPLKVLVHTPNNFWP